ncbi:hypothetical protein SprV_0802465400 [Sparganum proliferum]
MQERLSTWNIHRRDQNQRYEIIPTENRSFAEGSETADTHDGSAASEVEISRDTERAVESGSPGVTDARQVKGRHSINQARKYAPTLYTIEEVSTEQEEEEEEEYFEDIEEEEEDAEENETEKMRHDGLSEGKEEKEQGKAKEVEDKEEEKRENNMVEREKQVEEVRVVEEEERVGNENIEETGQNVDGKENKEEDAEAKEMTQSKLDAKRYTQQSANTLDASHRKMKTEARLVSQTGKYEEDGETSTSGDVSQHLTRAERWAMRRHDLAVGTIELLLREKYDEKENCLGSAQIIQLLKFCLESYFTFDGTIYEQVKGTSMGSPISGCATAARFAGFPTQQSEILGSVIG